MTFQKIPHPSGNRRETWRKYGANMEELWKIWSKHGGVMENMELVRICKGDFQNRTLKRSCRMKGGKGGKVDYD